MGTKRRILLAAIVIGALGTLTWFLLSHRKPTYNGKRLTEWLANYNGAVSEQELENTDEAMRQMGPTVVPTLLMMLDARDSAVKMKLINLAETHGVHVPPFPSAYEKQMMALSGFKALGPMAKPAIPGLARMLARGQILALHVLSLIGPDSIGALTNALSNKESRIKIGIVQALSEYATNSASTNENGNAPEVASGFRQAAAQIIPALLWLARDPDEDVREWAKDGVACFSNAPEVAVPLLIPMLKDKNPGVRHFAASSLIAFGPAAVPAVPSLFYALSDDKPSVRASAIEALAHVGSADTNVPPRLLKLLDDSNPETRESVARALGSSGNSARFAVPRLTQALQDPNGWVRIAAAGALRSIDPDAAAQAGVK
jgi:hypothetical protein